MPGRKPHEAVRAFLEPLNRAASTVTTTPFLVSPKGYIEGRRHGIRLGSEDLISLKAGPHRYNFSASIEYDVIENPSASSAADKFRVTTRGYMYHLLTEDFQDILLWHWHPEGHSHYTGPHLHIGKVQLGLNAVAENFQHVPTGRIAFEDVLLHLIQTSRVETLRTRDESVEVLMSSLQLFHQHRTWHA